MIVPHPVSVLPLNSLGRDFVVGDIHGCYSALKTLLRHVGFRPASDRLFSVGDLIDRGHHSYEVLKLLRQPWFFACRGNHEQMLIDHLRAPNLNPAHDPVWIKSVCSTFTTRQQFAGTWLPILERLPYVLRVGEGRTCFYVVHAEILEDRATVTQDMIDKWLFRDPQKATRRNLWGRSLFRAYEEGRPVKRAHAPNTPIIFCGHTITDTPLQLAQQVFLDGGAYLAYDVEQEAQRGKHFVPTLRMMDVQQNICWSVNAHDGSVFATPIDLPPTA